MVVFYVTSESVCSSSSCLRQILKIGELITNVVSVKIVPDPDIYGLKSREGTDCDALVFSE